jgi:hypothetical protein
VQTSTATVVTELNEVLELARIVKSVDELEDEITARKLLKRYDEHPVVVAATAEVVRKNHLGQWERVVTHALAIWAMLEVGNTLEALEAQAQSKAKLDDDKPEGSTLWAGSGCEVEGQVGVYTREATVAEACGEEAMGDYDLEETARWGTENLVPAFNELERRCGWRPGHMVEDYLRQAGEVVLPMALKWRETARFGGSTRRASRNGGGDAKPDAHSEWAGRKFQAALAKAKLGTREQAQAAVTLLVGPVPAEHRRLPWFFTFCHGDWAKFTADEWEANGSAWFKLFAKLGAPIPRRKRTRVLASLVASAAQPNPETEPLA